MSSSSHDAVTISICTYNRAEQLRKTLSSLNHVAVELLPGDEIIVVDNNGSDHTHDVVKNFRQLLPIRYVIESTQGLSAARNCALLNAKNHFLIFIDDDITVLPGCIKRYRRAALEHKNIDFFGGKIEVDWQGAQPGWYQGNRLPMLDGLIGRYDPLGDTVTYPPEAHLPFGANFAVRRALVDKVGKFDPNLGVKGESIARGEESDYFQRAIEVGFKGLYLHEAAVGHRFQVERISLAYLFRYGVQKGLMVENPTKQAWVARALSQVLRGLFQLLRGRKDRFYQCVINSGVARGVGLANKRAQLPNKSLGGKA